MKIKTTLGALIDGADALNEIAKQALSARTAYAVAKAMRAAEAETAAFYDARRAIIERYADKSTGRVEKDEDVIAASREIDDLRAEVDGEEAEITVRQIRLSELSDLRVKPIHLMQIDWLITDDEESAPAPAAKRKNGRKKEVAEAD